MDACAEVSGSAVDWLLLLMTGMLIRGIFIDPGDPEMSHMHRNLRACTHVDGKHTWSRLLSMHCIG